MVEKPTFNEGAHPFPPGACLLHDEKSGFAIQRRKSNSVTFTATTCRGAGLAPIRNDHLLTSFVLHARLAWRGRFCANVIIHLGIPGPCAVMQVLSSWDDLLYDVADVEELCFCLSSHWTHLPGLLPWRQTCQSAGTHASDLGILAFSSWVRPHSFKTSQSSCDTYC